MIWTQVSWLSDRTVYHSKKQIIEQQTETWQGRSVWANGEALPDTAGTKRRC